jgi:hypothetical protein
MLRAAFWVGHVLGQHGEREDVAHESWMDLPLAGDVDLAELRAAEHALLGLGLVRRTGSRLVADARLRVACTEWQADTPELILTLALETARPLWLRAATREGELLMPELVPDGAATALATVLPDPARREAFLLARARSVDVTERLELGAAGEEFVEAACRAELVEAGHHALAAAVRRVSVLSDELGYDITAPRVDGAIRRLEVKATRSAGPEIVVIVTRNELTVGLRDPDWFLVAVRVDRNGQHELVGHTAAAPLKTLLPEDRHARGRWQATRLRLSVATLSPGLPPAAY